MRLPVSVEITSTHHTKLHFSGPLCYQLHIGSRLLAVVSIYLTMPHDGVGASAGLQLTSWQKGQNANGE